jgi:hypothetical protein
MKSEQGYKLLPGEVYGKLTILGKSYGYKGQVAVLCECGTLRAFDKRAVATGRVRSCGCMVGRPKHGLRNAAEYDMWRAIKKRCYNKTHKFYHRYGGNGVLVWTLLG